VGAAGNDRGSGGPGLDSISGGGGDDSMATALRGDTIDGRADSVRCGDGVDDVTGEAIDIVGPNCETVTTAG